MATKWASNASRACVVLFALALPLAASPFITDSTFASRLLVVAAAVALGLAATAARGPVLPRTVAAAAAAGVLAFVAASLAGQTPTLSLLGRYPRYEGLATLLLYLATMVAGTRLLSAGQPALRRLFYSASSVAAVATAVVAAGQATLQPEQRVTALLGNSSVLGAWALVSCCLLGWGLVQHHRPLWLAGFGASLLTVALSASRGAMLALAIALAAAAAVRLGSARSHPWWVPLLPATGLGVAAWLLPTTQLRLSGQTPFAGATVDGRWLLWADSWQLLQQHPWLGVGPSRFVDAIGQFHSPAWASAVGPYAPPDSPHNFTLQVLASTGFAGTVAVVALVVAVAFQLWRSRPWDTWAAGCICAAIGLGAFLAFSFTDPVNTSVLLFCLGGALARPSQPNRSGVITTSVLGIASAALAAVLSASALVAEARFSAALAAQPIDAGTLVAVTEVRPWDVDLARRVGHAVARLAERGVAEPRLALPVVENACRAAPTSTECLQTLGDLQALAGDPGSAVDTLNRALELDPFNVDTLLRRGIAHAEAGSPDTAELDFLTAAELRPSAPEPWENLAALYHQQGRLGDANQAQRRADDLRRR